MVVVQTYFPDAQYSEGDATREDYSQLLGVRAAAVKDGTPEGRWRLSMQPMKPDPTLVKHPKRLLMSDLTTHLMFYALFDPN